MKKPKYIQIKEYLKTEALKPEAVTGLPSVRTLMARFNVAMATVHQALVELEHENVIIRQQGRGIIAARSQRNPVRVPQALKKDVILLVYPDYPSELLWRIAFMAGQCARQRGFEVITYKTYPDTSIQMIAEEAAALPNCRELLLIPAAERFNHDNLQLLGKLSIPVVFLDNLFDYPELPANIYRLEHDPVLAGQLISQCLLENGHQTTGYIRNEPQSDYSNRKQDAFIKAMKQQGGRIFPSHVFSETVRSWDNALLFAQKITRKNLESIRDQGITALAYTSTLGAFGSIPVLAENGIRVPDDISLIGEGDLSWFENANPPLTVLRPTFSELCLRAMELAEGKFRSDHLFFCSQQIVLRKSVKKIS